MGFFSSYSGNNEQAANVEFVLKMLDKLIPPVGSIYMSTSSVNPSTVYPGTVWVTWGSGKVPIGVDVSQTEFNSVEKTGGKKTHTLTYSEIPDHNHIVMPHHGKVDKGSGDEVCDNKSSIALRCGPSNDYPSVVTLAQARANYNSNYDVPEGLSYPGDAPHNNLQPYVTCYMWKRTG
jgi:microcystin-dependent protein